MKDRKSLVAVVLVAIVAVVATGTSSARTTSHRGGTLKLLAKAAGGTLDPQVNYTLSTGSSTRRPTTACSPSRRRAATRRSRSCPTSRPSSKLTNGGKTWMFTLRKGIKFSNGQTVTVERRRRLVPAHLQGARARPPAASTPASSAPTTCLKTPATCTLEGRRQSANAKTNTVTINLTAPDPEFTYKLAVPHAAILPASSPPNDAGTKLLPGTGAYYFASYDPNKQLVMKRNPYFKEWSQDAQPDGYPDEITQSFGLTVEAQITAIENGQADWTLEAPPADRLERDRDEVRERRRTSRPLTAFWYAPMNVEPRAVQQPEGAAGRQLRDRPERARQDLRRPEARGAVLPGAAAGLPGHKPYCPYTKNPGTTWSAPDVAKAKQLVKESGTTGAKVVVISPDDEVEQGRSASTSQSVLNQIGYKATVKPISGNIPFTYIQNTKNKVQINVQQWYQDYPAASDFLNVLFGCESFHPGSDSSINIAGFCDKPINAQMHKALKLEHDELAGGEPALGEDRPAGDRPGADGDAVHAAAHRLRVEARRQLHVQQAVLLAGRPVLGAVAAHRGAR